MNGWRYYNQALIPTCAPHETPDASNIKALLKENKKALFARWTEDFDCPEETGWWYVIKDTPFDINSVKAKRRYEINKGLKNFNIKIIDPNEYKEHLWNVANAAYETYPSAYRPNTTKDSFFRGMENWKTYKVYGAFDKSNQLQGYGTTKKVGNWINFISLKTVPQAEKNAVNAALVFGILEDLKEDLKKGAYLCDGERNVMHETAFPEYLIKYFSFRKAFCKLKMQYPPLISIIIRIFYPFRNLIKKFKRISFVSKIHSVLLMEEIARSQKKK